MCSPLDPVLANIFMGFYESKGLNEHNLNKPNFYLKYVDNILAALYKKQDLSNCLGFLNKRYRNIKFTIRKQIDHPIAFLNIFISGINNQNLIFQTYHKLTEILKLLHHFHIRLV